jgi:IS5 family transposase
LQNLLDLIPCGERGAVMAAKELKRAGFADFLVSGKAGANEQLERLDRLVKWYRFEKLAGEVRVEAPIGRRPWPVLVLVKAILLQSLYGLSERETEDALSDRLSFRRFLGLSLEEGVPDHSVLNRFRNLMIAEGVLEKLFAELDRQLEKAGVILKRGTMLDATLIATSAARPGSGERPSTDPEAAFAVRQGKSGSTFGYKAHVAVDEGSGIIRRVITTPANVNDTTPADLLISGEEKVVWADAAYHTHRREAALKAKGIKPRIARRANKHHPRLPARLALYNRLIARRRAAVETTFATWKRRMGFSTIRYLGLIKARAQVMLAAMAFNLRRWARLSPA